MVKVATPISHLFSNKEFADEIMRYSDCSECRDFSINSEVACQEVFHCSLQPIHKLKPKDFDYLLQIKELKRNLKLITFHVAASCDQSYVQNRMFQVGGTQYTEKQMYKNAKENFLIIKNLFDGGIDIAIENNNFYPTNAYQFITEPEFLSKIVYDNGINFLFDIAHAKITCHNKKTDYEVYKKNLPFDKIIQLHISSFELIDDELANDTHCCPTDEEFKEVKTLLNCFDIRYLTIEYFKDKDSLIYSLKILKELL